MRAVYVPTRVVPAGAARLVASAPAAGAAAGRWSSTPPTGGRPAGRR